MSEMIIKEWLNVPQEIKTEYPFKVVKITDRKKVDSPTIEYLQKNILFSYEEKESLDFALDGSSNEYKKEYIKSIYPNINTAGGPKMADTVQKGDFGEIITKIVLKEFYGRDSLNKLKYKFNSGRSVFGTDLISFDNIENPQYMYFCETKFRKKLDKEYVKNGEAKNPLYISVIAHNSLQYDTRQTVDPVMRFMMTIARETKDFERAKTLREIMNGKRPIQKGYEIFLLSEDKNGDFEELQKALNDIENRLDPLSMTLILVDDFSLIEKNVWENFEQFALGLYGVKT